MATVLVVDDAAFVRHWCRDVLTRAGHSVLEAANRAEAVQLFSELRPDLVVLDINMPGASGIQTLGELRQIDPRARVLMLTAIAEKEIVLAARRLGALGYLKKPTSSERLLASVNGALPPPPEGATPPAGTPDTPEPPAPAAGDAPSG